MSRFFDLAAANRLIYQWYYESIVGLDYDQWSRLPDETRRDALLGADWGRAVGPQAEVVFLGVRQKRDA